MQFSLSLEQFDGLLIFNALINDEFPRKCEISAELSIGFLCNLTGAITRAKAKTSSSNLTGDDLTEKKISTCNSWFRLEHHILHLNLSIILLTEMAEIELSQKYEVKINLRCTFITKTISRVVTARECWNDDERLDWSNLITSEYCNGRMNC